jgi:hypothetical protein
LVLALAEEALLVFLVGLFEDGTRGGLEDASVDLSHFSRHVHYYCLLRGLFLFPSLSLLWPLKRVDPKKLSYPALINYRVGLIHLLTGIKHLSVSFHVELSVNITWEFSGL